VTTHDGLIWRATVFDPSRQVVNDGDVPSTRSASLAGFADLVRELGGDPTDIARRVGMPVEALASFEVPVELDVSARALELAASELDRPDFGLSLGDRQQLQGLGPLAIAIQHAPNLGDALACAQRFLSLHNQGSSLALEDDPYDVRGIAGLRFVWHYEGRAYPQSMDKMLLNVHRVVQALTGGEYDLRTVELSYRPAAPLSRYEELFGGVRINLGQPLTLLRMPRSLLQQPIAGAQSAAREMAMAYLASQVLPDELTTTGHVRSALSALLGTGRISTTWVAAHLELSPRTLQRRLGHEKTTYAQLLDDVRRERARALLGQTDLSMGQISAMLDFADQATLSRSARRWWGVSTSEKRRQLRLRTEWRDRPNRVAHSIKFREGNPGDSECDL